PPAPRRSGARPGWSARCSSSGPSRASRGHRARGGLVSVADRARRGGQREQPFELLRIGAALAEPGALVRAVVVGRAGGDEPELVRKTGCVGSIIVVVVRVIDLEADQAGGGHVGN